MSALDPAKLHVRFMDGVNATGALTPRRYTLTHSDRSGELFLAIGPEYDRKQIGGWYTRLMRDEVLAEWRDDDDGPALHVFCHVSGGLVFGRPGWRYRIFRHHMRQVVQAFRHGDAQHIHANISLDDAPLTVHFQARQERYNRVEEWGQLRDYRLIGNSGKRSKEGAAADR